MQWPKRRRRRDALAGDWRRTNKDSRLALPGDEDGFGLRRRSPNLHQNNGDCKNRDGRHCVHGDTELAVVGVRAIGVLVGYLGHG